MTQNGWLQIIFYLVVLVALAKPLGAFMAKVYQGERTFLTPVFAPLERLTYRLAGIHPEDQTLLQMARDSGLSVREIASVSVALGMSGVGVTMVILAVLDLEPTSKLGLLVGGGTVCVLGGGFQAIRILTNHKPPKITATAHGIEISWS